MTLPLAAALTALALIDSTSFGTLLIPIWLLLTPGRVRGRRMASYLGAVAAFYFLVGLLLVAGASAAFETLAGLRHDLPAEALRGAQLAAGVGLFWWSFRLEARAKRSEGQSRIQRWQARAMSGGSGSGVMSLALVACALEVATMLPYLAAIGLLANADLGAPATAASLAGYCVVMLVPALALTALRLAAHERIDPLLQRLQGWLTRHTGTLLGWTVGGIGVWLSLNALANLTFAG